MTLCAGTATGYLRHEYNYVYVVVPMTTGKPTIVGRDGGVTTAELSAGASYFRQVGAEHDVINAIGLELVFVEIEFK